MKYIAIVLLFISGLAQALTIDELRDTFATQTTVRAKFTQERQIKNIRAPLISTGSMLLSQEKGLWWQQREPFVTTLILRDNEMIQRMNGQPDQTITAENNPQMFQFNALMRALIKADKTVLENHFTTTFTDKGQGKWQLHLVPVTTPLDKLFSEISLSGSQVIEQVVLTDKQGDATTITFSDHQLMPENLTPEEARYFD